jgi:hypothetical protein
MSTHEKGTFVPPALDSTHALPSLPDAEATPQDNLLYCQQMLAHYNEQLNRFMAIFGMDYLHAQSLERIISDKCFYTQMIETWRKNIKTMEGQTDV